MNNLYQQKFLKLSNKRYLSFSIIGDMNGEPILFFHGWPGTRNDISCMDKITKKLGAKIISIDRPGCGLSDFQKKRKIDDFNDDIEILLDKLKIDKFRILAFSTGGIYAFNSAPYFKDRIKKISLVSAVPYFEIDIDEIVLNKYIKFLKIFSKTPIILRSILRIASDLGLFFFKINPQKQYEKDLQEMPLIDQQTWNRKDIRDWFHQIYFPDLLKSSRKGLAWDLFLLINTIYHPKSKSLARKISTKIVFWHGKVDNVVPYSVTREQAKYFPDAEVNYYDGEGHKVIYTHFEDIIKKTLIK